MVEYDAKELAKDLAKGMGVKKLKAKYGQEALNDAGLGEMRRNWAYSYRGENLALLETSVKLDDNIEGLEGILEAVESMNPSKRVKQYETVRSGLDALSETLEDYIRTSYDDEVDDLEIEKAIKDLSEDPAFANYINESAAEVVEPESLDGTDIQPLNEVLNSFESYPQIEEPTIYDFGDVDAGETLETEPLIVDEPNIDDLEEVVDSPEDFIASPVMLVRSEEERASDYIEDKVNGWIFHMSKADEVNACLAEKLESIKSNPYAKQYIATLSAKINQNRDLFPKRDRLLDLIAGFDGHSEYEDVTELPVVPVFEKTDYSFWKRVNHIATTAGVLVTGVCGALVGTMMIRGLNETNYSTNLESQYQERKDKIYEQRNVTPSRSLIEITDDHEALAQAVQETTEEIKLEAKRFWDETLPTVVGVDDKSVASNVESPDYVIIDKDGNLKIPSQQLAMNLNGHPMATNDPSAGCPLPRMLIPQGNGTHVCGGEEQIDQFYMREKLERAIARNLGIGFGGDALASDENNPEETT